MTSAAAPPGGDQDRGSSLIAIFWVESAIACIVVSLRICARIMIQKVGVDDYMMLLTLLLFLILASFTTYLASIGGCRHLFFLSPQQQLHAVKYNWISQVWGIFGFATGKISVALLILRIIGPNKFWRKWTLYAVMVSVFLINALGCIITFVQCNPPRALWAPKMSSYCWDPRIQSDYAIFLSSWNVFVDVILAMLPITFFWPLQMSRKKRISLCVLLGLGLLAGICGAVKIQYLAGLNARSDLTWETYNLYAWSGSELFVIMTCGSIPPIKPLYDYVFNAKRHRPGAYSPQGPYERSYELKGGNNTIESECSRSTAAGAVTAG